MNNIIYKTKFPILSHKGEELLPADCILDNTTLENLQTRKSKGHIFSLASVDFIKNDLKGFLERPPYDFIFKCETSRDLVFSMLKEVVIPIDVVEILEHFREKDFCTYRHMLVVFAISTHLVSLLADPFNFRKSINASIVHDIGKCSVPVEIMNKKTPLTRIEREHLEHHTLAGYGLIYYYMNCEEINLTSRAARDHHEQCDGSGYPAGLTSISKFIEIIIACDMYDALISERPNRITPFDNRTALEELSKKALNGKLSAWTVQALIASNRNTTVHWTECVLSKKQRGLSPEDNNYGLFDDS